jgi:(p)ppGpp synthase/HD superfamily hydrolase
VENQDAMDSAMLESARRGDADFVRELPRTRAALAFADERHAGQLREIDGAPFVTHPLEVACFLQAAGYEDEVVAAGVLHDVIEDTNAQRSDLERRFGSEVARLVAAVTDDPSIADAAERKAALRLQVAQAGEAAAVIFAADKVSKARELKQLARRGPLGPQAQLRLEHYRESLSMLDGLIPGHDLVKRLRSELAELEASATRRQPGGASVSRSRG